MPVLFKLSIICLIISCFACATTAGPFVTTISNDGDSGLTVEKCMVKLDPWFGTVSNTDCRSTAVKVGRK